MNKKIILFLILLIVFLINISNADKIYAASKIFPQGNGVWVWRTDKDPSFFNDINVTILNLKKAGITWVAVKAGDGDSLWTNSAVLWLTSNISKFHDAGIKVYGWQYVYGNDDVWSVPNVSEADVANQILNISGIDGLIIDVESEYENLSENRLIATTYLQAIRSQHPDSFIAYTTFARPASHSNFPYFEFNNYCDVVMPQAYWVDRPTTPTDELTTLKKQWDDLYSTWPNNPGKPIYPLASLNTATVGQLEEFFTVIRALNFQNPSFWRYELITFDLWNSFYKNSIYTAYQNLLGREPDQSGLGWYTSLMANNGWTIEQVRNDIMNSQEYKARQITLTYKDLLGRDPDPSGFNWYLSLVLNQGWTINQVRNDISYSPEYRFYQVNLLYNDLLGRDPDPGGLNHYTSLMANNGWTIEQVRNDIMNSQEYKARQITLTYKDLLGRDPDPSGFNWYLSLVLNQGWTINQVRNDIMHSSEFASRSINLIKQAYNELLLRDPDPGGLNHYTSLMQQGWTIDQVRNDITNSQEYKTLHSNPI